MGCVWTAEKRLYGKEQLAPASRFTRQLYAWTST
jgi:hypothetical protein